MSRATTKSCVHARTYLDQASGNLLIQPGDRVMQMAWWRQNKKGLHHMSTNTPESRDRRAPRGRPRRLSPAWRNACGSVSQCEIKEWSSERAQLPSLAACLPTLSVCNTNCTCRMARANWKESSVNRRLRWYPATTQISTFRRSPGANMCVLGMTSLNVFENAINSHRVMNTLLLRRFYEVLFLL